jgi:putative membrane protein
VLLANERTALAWSRTSLAIAAAGLAVLQFADRESLPYGRRLLGLPLLVAAVVLAGWSSWRYLARDRDLRAGRPLQRSRLPLAAGAVVVAAGLVALGLGLAAG